jgi:hypothetical protein
MLLIVRQLKIHYGLGDSKNDSTSDHVYGCPVRTFILRGEIGGASIVLDIVRPFRPHGGIGRLQLRRQMRCPTLRRGRDNEESQRSSNPRNCLGNSHLRRRGCERKVRKRIRETVFLSISCQWTDPSRVAHKRATWTGVAAVYDRQSRA